MFWFVAFWAVVPILLAAIVCLAMIAFGLAVVVGMQLGINWRFWR